MESPESRYAKTLDGVYIAYQTVGDGPIDIVWQFDWLGNVDTIWEYRPSAEWFRGLASFSRLILYRPSRNRELRVATSTSPTSRPASRI